MTLAVPTSVEAGEAIKGTVELLPFAPEEQITVRLASDNLRAARVLPTVTIPTGRRQQSFEILTGSQLSTSVSVNVEINVETTAEFAELNCTAQLQVMGSSLPM